MAQLTLNVHMTSMLHSSLVNMILTENVQWIGQDSVNKVRHIALYGFFSTAFREDSDTIDKTVYIDPKDIVKRIGFEETYSRDTNTVSSNYTVHVLGSCVEYGDARTIPTGTHCVGFIHLSHSDAPSACLPNAKGCLPAGAFHELPVCICGHLTPNRRGECPMLEFGVFVESNESSILRRGESLDRNSNCPDRSVEEVCRATLSIGTTEGHWNRFIRMLYIEVTMSLPAAAAQDLAHGVSNVFDTNGNSPSLKFLTPPPSGHIRPTKSKDTTEEGDGRDVADVSSIVSGQALDRALHPLNLTNGSSSTHNPATVLNLVFPLAQFTFPARNEHADTSQRLLLCSLPESHMVYLRGCLLKPFAVCASQNGDFARVVHQALKAVAQTWCNAGAATAPATGDAASQTDTDVSTVTESGFFFCCGSTKDSGKIPWQPTLLRYALWDLLPIAQTRTWRGREASKPVASINAAPRDPKIALRQFLSQMLAISSHPLLVSPHTRLMEPWDPAHGSFVSSRTLVAGAAEGSVPPYRSYSRQRYVVQGWYQYFHYQCDGFKDVGWGCAYRSCQTILSWYWLNGYGARGAIGRVSADGDEALMRRSTSRRKADGAITSFLRTVPSVAEMQKLLQTTLSSVTKSVESNASERVRGISSTVHQWIGSFEVMALIQFYLPFVHCTLDHVPSGDDLFTSTTLIQKLQRHFQHCGAPVMIGGHHYANTILGIEIVKIEEDEVHESVGTPTVSVPSTRSRTSVRYLILDPHYEARGALIDGTGKSYLDGVIGDGRNPPASGKAALKKVYCAWRCREEKFFNTNAFYNLCIPSIIFNE